jgi:hypothetical protein
MSNHAFDKNFIKKHEKVGSSTEGGKCLTRHVSRVKENSCSHRWQAWHRAKSDDARWYKTYPDAHKVFNPPPPAGTWDPLHGNNFRKSARKPYRHNAHHILPNGVLRDCINEAAAQAGDKGAALRILIRGGLLDAGYNLNHKLNMIILPGDQRVAWVLKLPAHVEKGKRAHEEYSAEVSKRVEQVMQDFAQVMAKSVQAHDAPPNKLDKKKLERISDSFRKAIRAWGKARHLLLLDRIPPAHYSNY